MSPAVALNFEHIVVLTIDCNHQTRWVVHQTLHVNWSSPMHQISWQPLLRNTAGLFHILSIASWSCAQVSLSPCFGVIRFGMADMSISALYSPSVLVVSACFVTMLAGIARNSFSDRGMNIDVAAWGDALYVLLMGTRWSCVPTTCNPRN